LQKFNLKNYKGNFLLLNSLLLFGKENSSNFNTGFSFGGNFHKFFLTNMEPINFESIFGIMANGRPEGTTRSQASDLCT
jgi:hypothetical protein